jgi:hypothetical protein
MNEVNRPLLRILRSRHSHVHVQHGWRLAVSQNRGLPPSSESMLLSDGNRTGSDFSVFALEPRREALLVQR